MKFEELGEVRRHMDAIGLNLEYVDVLLRDVIEGFLMPLAHGDHTPGTLAKIEAGPTLTKAEMLETFMGQITEHHNAMLPFIFTPDPIPDHSTMTTPSAKRRSPATSSKPWRKSPFAPTGLKS